MRLMNNLRNAEKRGMASVRRQVERAKDEWSDVERRIRQRMRIYPQKLRDRMNTTGEAEMEPESVNQPLAAATTAPAGKPIVSVNGRDVPEQEIDKNVA